MGFRAALFFALWAVGASGAGLPTQASVPAPRLAEAERNELRYRLENLYNELDVLVRNERSDDSGRARIERHFAGLRLYQRIPMEASIGSLKEELSHRASELGVRLLSLDVLSHDQPKKPVPRELLSDTPKFRIEDDQLTETFHLKLTLAGDGPRIEEWIQTWPQDQLRLIEPERGYTRPGLTPAGPGRFTLRARTFRFRNIRFPRLKPRDPITLLPAWARRDPAAFASSEPFLWQYVRRIREKIPETPEPFEKKGALLLDSARMSFFLSKAK